jgi:hypothetical protein
MSKSAPWSQEEDNFIIDAVQRGLKNRQLVPLFHARFGDVRTRFAIAKRRAFLYEPPPELERQLADYTGLPSEIDEHIELTVVDDVGFVTVAASASIRNPEELFEKSELDPDLWEMVDKAPVRKWDVPMKVGDKPIVVPCYYVAIKVQKRWDHSKLPRPVVVEVEVPKTKVGVRSKDTFTSVHYSDIHFPHHDPATLSVLYDILSQLEHEGGVDLVVDHGDLLDAEQLSRWPKDPHRRTSLRDELLMAAKHCGIVHALTPDADHWFLAGNHEARITKTIWALCESRTAGELLTLPEVTETMQIENLLGLTKLGWDYTPYPKHRILFDKLVLCHGETAKKHSGASERAEYERYGKGGASGHTHRVGHYSLRNAHGTHSWWGMGMMGKVRDDYTSFPNWSQGFLVITWSEDRTEYHVERVRIFDGVGYFRGKRYDGNKKDAKRSS